MKGKRTRSQGMYLSIAQAKYAFKKLTGEKIGDRNLQAEMSEIFRTHGEQKILEAIADYDADRYVNGEYDC